MVNISKLKLNYIDEMVKTKHLRAGFDGGNGQN